MGSLLASQTRQTITMTMVAGTVVTQYTHSLSDTCHDPSSSLMLKNVVLKRAYKHLEQEDIHDPLTLTEMKVAGRKIMVRSAIDFMTLLSWRARLLKAYCA